MNARLLEQLSYLFVCEADALASKDYTKNKDEVGRLNTIAHELETKARNKGWRGKYSDSFDAPELWHSRHQEPCHEHRALISVLAPAHP